MIQLTSTHPLSGKSTLNLVILPDDLAQLMNGLPLFVELTSLKDIDASAIVSVSVSFFRDKGELNEALQVVGAEMQNV